VTCNIPLANPLPAYFTDYLAFGGVPLKYVVDCIESVLPYEQDDFFAPSSMAWPGKTGAAFS
jgi:hypothetical protein